MAKSYSFLKNKSIEVKENFYFEKQEIKETNFEVKPVSYLKSSLIRFSKNKASVIAFAILIVLFLYALITPLVSPFSYVNKLDYDVDGMCLKTLLPKNKMFENSSFWDGTDVRTINDVNYYLYKFYDTKNNPIKEEFITKEMDKDDEIIYGKQFLHEIRYDSYAVGSYLINLSNDEYQSLCAYEKENNINIILPLVNYSSYLNEYKSQLEQSKFNYSTTLISQTISNMQKKYSLDANVTYEIEPILDSNGKILNNNIFLPKFSENNDVNRLYSIDENNNYITYSYENGEYKIRVDFYEYFIFKYGFEPIFLFGSNSAGQDLFLRLAKGTLFSLCLGIIVSLINFIIGLIYGAIEGYYGGKIDLFMERFSEIISAIPATIILVICNIYFTNSSLESTTSLILGLLVAYILTGWIGVASQVRTQFYRYKNQEYVLASRSLGAKDGRLIFKHILPNAIGPIITSSVLMVPSVIFSESSLSYLGIIDFSTSSLSSIGQLLNEGNSTLGTNLSFLLIFPSIVVCLLMISFNLFGNGLRDAFNTNLVGER